MNFLPWLRFDVSMLIESFMTLVRQQYWLSVLIILTLLVVLAIYLATMVGNAVVQVRRVAPHFAAWYVLVPVSVSLVAMLGASVTAVDYLRAGGIPVPSLSNIHAVFGENQVLQWDLPSNTGAMDLMFEVQASEDPAFPLRGTERNYVRDTVFPLIADDNKTLYWRVRAIQVDPDPPRRPLKFGVWSRPVQIPQYSTVLEKIVRTQRLTISMENEFGRSKFRWFEAETERSSGDQPLWRALAYRGVEIDIAYAIADEACRTRLEGQKSGVKVLACIPAMPDEKQAAALEACRKDRGKECVSIEVQFASLPWSEVMKSVGEGRYDLAISNITYKPERESEHRILFGTQSYEATGHAFVARHTGRGPSEERTEVTDAAALLTGKAVGVQVGTTSYDCMKFLERKMAVSGPAPFTVVEQSQSTLAVNMLLRGKASFDMVLTDGTFADGWRDLRGDSIVVKHALPAFFGEGAPDFCLTQEYRIAVKAGEYDLQELTDRVVHRMVQSGDLDRIKHEAAERFRQNVRARERLMQEVTAAEVKTQSRQ